MAPPTFASVVPIMQSSSHTYTVMLENEWCIGTVPNGGYITSAFLVVARTHMSSTHNKRSQPHPINLHLEFLRRTSVGAARFTVKDVKLGSRISNLHITLSQRRDPDDENSPYQDEVQGYITMSNITTEEGLTLDSQYAPYPPPLPANLTQLSTGEGDENYMTRAADPFPSFRRAAQNAQFFLVRPSKRATPDSSKGITRSSLDQWIRFRPQTPSLASSAFKIGDFGRWTNDALGFLVDMFPQIIETYVNPFVEEAAMGIHTPSEVQAHLAKQKEEPRAKYWYPTLALNLDVKKLLPEEGVEWLFVRVKAKVIRNGRFDFDIEVWDTQGELVATSQHASLVMDASRNTTRSSGGTQKKESKL
jgi:acyl-coenzyme A thioesterase PaaI-like protein